MSYQVLARKWRPRSFPEMVGQEHVLRALINALDHNRLHHAFLFTGTRGVGKTTVARILAKSLNCEQGVGSHPCGECSACREINEGRFVDLIEVDAASRTRVEDTRELLDNVQYAPTRGRYKVYLIDEVHMLSNSSFNALLKTLEEPPPHVKFLLATTDPQRLPVTILSRCLQFSLKRLSVEQIRPHLSHILESEAIPAEPEAISEIARGADGSMRDALSLLDQAIAFGGGQLVASEVREMLGTVDRGQVLGLIDALADEDGERLMAVAGQLSEHAPDFGGLLGALNTTLHRIALAQLVPTALGDEEGEREVVVALAERLSPEAVQLCYQIGTLAARDLPFAPDPRIGFEMALLRMLAFRPLDQPSPTGGGRAQPSSRPARRRSPSAEITAPAQAPASHTAEAPTERSTTLRAEIAPEPTAPVDAPPSSEHAVEVREEPAPEFTAVVDEEGTNAAPRAAEEASEDSVEPPPFIATPFPSVEEPVAESQAISAAPPDLFGDTVVAEAPVAEVVIPAAGIPPGDDGEGEPKGSGLPSDGASWCNLVAQLPLVGMTRQYAEHCAYEGCEAGRISLRLDAAFQHLMSPKWREALEKILSEHLACTIRLQVRLGEAASPGVETPREQLRRQQAERQQMAEEAIAADPWVRQLLDRFNGEVEGHTIRPTQ